jgi:GntR family transcriptional regulator, arabinose operon transcriptional repressor
MLLFKYQEIINFFKDEIEAGKRKPGDKIPDLDELKKQFDTSAITVNRALNELQTGGFIQRVKGQGSFISEIPRKQGQKAGLNSGRFISCIIPFDLTQNDFIHSVESISRERNFLFNIQNSKFSSELERECLIRAKENGASGVIAYPVSNSDNIDIYSRMIIERFPFVIIDRRLNAMNHPFVTCSNEESFYRITDYLVGKGHRRIGFLCGDISLSTTNERFHGYCKALMNAGIAIDKSLVVDHFYVQRDKPDGAKIRGILGGFMSDSAKVTAIACANDFIASMVILEADAMGIRIPEDLSITGFDNLYFTSYLKPPLTTVIQPFKEIGENAAKLLIDMIESRGIDMKTIECPASIIERDSVRVIPEKREGVSQP